VRRAPRWRYLLVLALASLAGLGLWARHEAPGDAAEKIQPTTTSASVTTPRPERRLQKTTPVDVYAHIGPGSMQPEAARARPLVYVPNSEANTVDVIDPRTYRVISSFPVGALPQHVTPSHDLRTLYVDNDAGNSLTPINPRTGRPGRSFPVDDPYNLYFTPNGRYAIVVAERLHRLDFRNPHTFRLIKQVQVPCAGVNHMDFSPSGSYAVVSCEFSGQLLKVDLRRLRVVAVRHLPRQYSVPQDVRSAPDGKVFYVADLAAGGIWEVVPNTLKVVRLIPTGAGAHGLVVSRNGRVLYVANRNAGTVSLLSFRTRRIVRTWRIPGGGSPDMGDVSPNGRVLWLSGRFNAEVYAINTLTGRLIARIPVGASPHGVAVWPQPGRYSLGHTGNMR
jgi:YVTN family beta-propeller protein